MDKMYQQQQGSVQFEYQCNQWVVERKKINDKIVNKFIEYVNYLCY